MPDTPPERAAASADTQQKAAELQAETARQAAATQVSAAKTQKDAAITQAAAADTQKAAASLVQPRLPASATKAAGAVTAKAVKSVQDELERKTAGQRRVNLLWEWTQAIIAGSVVSVTLLVCFMLISRLGVPVAERDPALGAAINGSFLLLSNITNLVIGFYFGRTNHQRTGGVGGGEQIGR